MGMVILREPATEGLPVADRRYAIFSTITDTFKRFNLTAEEVADLFAKMERERTLFEIEQMEETLEKTGYNIWGTESFGSYLLQHRFAECGIEEINEEVRNRRKKK